VLQEAVADTNALLVARHRGATAAQGEQPQLVAVHGNPPAAAAAAAFFSGMFSSLSTPWCAGIVNPSQHSALTAHQHCRTLMLTSPRPSAASAAAAGGEFHCACAMALQFRDTATAPGRVEIALLATDTDHRGTGYASLMVSIALRAAAALGCVNN
jgi:ribosomal protein S18 acetylase RimI-like enzyme